MKKTLFLMLAVVMLLPMIAACSGQEGTPVEIANFSIVSYELAYPEAEEPATDEEASETTPSSSTQRDETLATVIYDTHATGNLTVYLQEGEKLTAKKVIDSYANDFDGAQVYDENTNRYTKLCDLAVGNGFNWIVYINGEEKPINTEIQATDAVKIVYEK